MSLFRTVDWVSHTIPTASCILNANLIEDRAQLIVGTENGFLNIIDAGAKQHEASIFMTYETKCPIMQLEVGEFLTGIRNVIVALSPKKMVYYQLSYDKKLENAIDFKPLFTHSFDTSAWNMCKINQPDQPPQILIQSIDCKLSLYQGDQCVFVNCPLRSLHPGPIVFCPSTASLLVANNGFLNCVKFSLLSSGSQKRINCDWFFNLGDTALQVELYESSQTSIIVLCRRHVSCMSTSGAIKWQIRLESVGTSVCIYRNLLSTDQSIRLVVSTSDDNLLIFNEDKLSWNCNANMSAVCLKIFSYNKIYENVLTMLSADGKLVLCYLGTEPNLYKVPTDTKIVNLAEKMEQLKAIEQKIKASEASGASLKKDDKMEIVCSLKETGKRTIESNARNNVPYCTITAEVRNLKNVEKLHMNIFSDFATPSKQIIVNCSPDQTSVNVDICFYIGNDKTPKNGKVFIAAHCVHSLDSCFQTYTLPLETLFFECSVDRSAKYRITFDTDIPVVALNKLIPELGNENPQSIGLQIHGSDESVSIFAANKSNRYRIQSEHPALLHWACEEMIRRIKNLEPNVQIGTVIPFEYISEVIDNIKEEESKLAEDSKRIDCRMKEVRAIEALSLNHCKKGNLEMVPHLDALLDKSYRELLQYMDQYTSKKKTISENNRTLGSLFSLASELSKISNVDTIINEYFYINTQQALRERLLWAAKSDRGSEMKLIEKLCEHSNKELPKIKEEDEEEEQEAS